MFAEHIFLSRLIRSLKDRHSMISGRLIQLGFETFLEKCKGLCFVFVDEDSCHPYRFFEAKVEEKRFYHQRFSSSSHFLIIDFDGMVLLDFTFPLMMRAGVERMPY